MKTPLLAIFASSFVALSNSAVAAETPFAIAIHGGAGTIEKARFTPAQEKEYRAKLTQAVETGYEVLHQGGESLDPLILMQGVERYTPTMAGMSLMHP